MLGGGVWALWAEDVCVPGLGSRWPELAMEAAGPEARGRLAPPGPGKTTALPASLRGPRRQAENTVAKSVDSGARRLGLNPALPFTSMAGYLTSLCLSFPSGRAGTIAIPAR